MFNKELWLKLCMDSKSLLHNIVRIHAPTEKRLVIDHSELQQSYESWEISQFVLIK